MQQIIEINHLTGSCLYLTTFAGHIYNPMPVAASECNYPAESLQYHDGKVWVQSPTETAPAMHPTAADALRLTSKSGRTYRDFVVLTGDVPGSEFMKWVDSTHDNRVPIGRTESETLKNAQGVVQDFLTDFYGFHEESMRNDYCAEYPY